MDNDNDFLGEMENDKYVNQNELEKQLYFSISFLHIISN